MKRIFLKGGFLGLMAVVALNLMGCSPARKTHAAVEQGAAVANAPTDGIAPSQVAAAVGPLCANPAPEMVPGCEAEARRILASTVRIEFHGPGGGIGHATVIGGRYLITHNHYPVTAATLRNGGEGLVTAVSVYKANGDVILLKAPLSYLTVAVEAPEMLVLDFNVYGGTGFFDSLGVPSAEYNHGAGLNLLAGSEVAQIDWDGTTAHVDWVRVTAIQTGGGTPSLEIDNFVEQGASGGGVFYNGILVGNNWTRQTDRLLSGEIVRQYTVATLNTYEFMTMAN